MVKDIKLLIESFFDDLDNYEQDIEQETTDNLIKSIYKKPDCREFNDIIDYVEQKIYQLYIDNLELHIIFDSWNGHIFVNDDEQNRLIYTGYNEDTTVIYVHNMIDFFKHVYDIKEEIIETINHPRGHITEHIKYTINLKLLKESYFDDMFDEHDINQTDEILPNISYEEQTHELMLKTLSKPDCGKVNEIFEYVEKNIDPVYSVVLTIILDPLYDQIVFYNKYLNLISYTHFSYKENKKNVDLMIDYFYRIYDIREHGRIIYPLRHGNKKEEITYNIKPKTVNESYFDDMFNNEELEDNSLLPQISQEYVRDHFVSTINNCGEFQYILTYIKKHIDKDDGYILNVQILKQSHIFFYDINKLTYIKQYDYNNRNKLNYDNMMRYLNDIYDVTLFRCHIDEEDCFNYSYKIKYKHVNESFFDDMFDEHDDTDTTSILKDIKTDNVENKLSSYSHTGLSSINRKYIDKTDYPEHISNDDYILYENYIKLCEDLIEHTMKRNNTTYNIKLHTPFYINYKEDVYDIICIDIPTTTIFSTPSTDKCYIYINKDHTYVYLPKIIAQPTWASTQSYIHISGTLLFLKILNNHNITCTDLIIGEGQVSELNIQEVTVSDMSDVYIPKIYAGSYTKDKHLDIEVFDKIKYVYFSILKENENNTDDFSSVLDYIKSFADTKTIIYSARTDEYDKIYKEWSIKNKNELYKFNSAENKDRAVAHIIGLIKYDYLKLSSGQNYMYNFTINSKGKNKTYGNFANITINIEYDDIDNNKKHRWIDVNVDFYQSGKCDVLSIKDSLNIIKYNK